MNRVVSLPTGQAGLPKDRQVLPQQLTRRDLARLKGYRENLEFYKGVQWPGGPRRGERRLTFNYVKVFIEKVTAYLMHDIRLVVTPREESREGWERARRAQEILGEMAEANNLTQLDFDTEIDAAILGDGCYKVTWDPGEAQVRVSAPDVQGVYGWWQGDDMSRVWRLASRYTLSQEEVELLYGVRDNVLSLSKEGGTLRPAQDGALARSSSTRLTTGREATVVEAWTPWEVELWVDNVLLERKPNPYRTIPFLLFPNLREPKAFWGLSDIPPLTEPARELNRALSQLSTILELSGNPIAVLENVEEAQDIAVQPGAVWELPERARAYLLDLLQGGGVKLHTDYVELLYRVLHDLSEAPRTAFGDNQRGLSGIALEMEMHPLLQKVRRKRLVRSTVYRRRAELMLRLWEQHTGEPLGPLRIEVAWGPLLPQDQGRQVENERILVASGIHSRRRAAQELGVEDPEKEFQRWLEEEREVGGRNVQD